MSIYSSCYSIQKNTDGIIIILYTTNIHRQPGHWLILSKFEFKTLVKK